MVAGSGALVSTHCWASNKMMRLSFKARRHFSAAGPFLAKKSWLYVPL
jgi:hypothetical protein